jgi:hypothetical protein
VALYPSPLNGRRIETGLPAWDSINAIGNQTTRYISHRILCAGS